MGLSAFGVKMFPNEIARVLTHYTKDGLIIWQNLNLPRFKFQKRLYGRNDGAIQASLKAPDEFVILQVDNQQHWVLATGKTLWGNDYRIADPWDAKRKTACGAYKNITGSAHFKLV